MNVRIFSGRNTLEPHMNQSKEVLLVHYFSPLPVKFAWFKDENRIEGIATVLNNVGKFKITHDDSQRFIALEIRNITTSDNGTYSLVLENRGWKEVVALHLLVKSMFNKTFNWWDGKIHMNSNNVSIINFKGKPNVTIINEENGKDGNLMKICHVKGYPPSKLSWTVCKIEEKNKCLSRNNYTAVSWIEFESVLE